MPNHIPYCRWQIISVDLIMDSPRVTATTPYSSPWITCPNRPTSSPPRWISPHSESPGYFGTAFGSYIVHGLPEEVISDRGPQFMSNFMRGLSEILGIKVAASMAYHHLQTDGQTEHVNQEMSNSYASL